MVVALCTAVMSKSRVCPRVPDCVQDRVLHHQRCGMRVAVPVTGCGIATKRRDDGIATLFALWTEAAEV